MDSTALVAFVGLVAAMVLVPGPDFMFMLLSGVRFRAVAAPVSGLVAGHGFLVACLALGVGQLVASIPVVLTVLTLIGAAYLMYLGVNVLRTATSTGAQDAGLACEMQRAQLFRQGFGVAAMNPKAILFYVAIVPQFASASTAWPLSLQFGTLGAIFVLGCLLIYIPVGLLSGRVISAHPRTSQLITRVAGVIMIVLSVGLLAEQFL
jgi:threonine/homoserine/homoserine lactone efflux protein